LSRAGGPVYGGPDMGPFDDPKSLRDFCIEAEQARDAVHVPANDRRRRRVGKHWRRGGWGMDSWVNAYHNLEVSLIHALCSKAPVAQVHCDNPGTGNGTGLDVADALEQGLDANSEQTRVHRVYSQAIASSIYDFGCTYTGLEPVPGYEGRLAPGAAQQAGWMPPPMRPRTWLIGSGMAFTDPLAPPEEGIAAGHVWIANKEELKALTDENGQPKFDPKLIDLMAVDSDADDVRKKAPFGDWVKRTAKRGDVVGYTVWCRETQTEYTMGFTSRTLGLDQQFLCEPKRSVIDDEEGPYTFWGMYWLEGQPYPFPITAAIQQLVDSRDLHRKKIDDDARSAMRFVAADGKKNAMKVAQAKNKRIINWPGFQGKFAIVDLGGPQPASVEYEAKLKGEQEEMTAISANRLGNQDPGVPATAILDTANELEGRKEYMRESIHHAASAEMRKRARLMFGMTTVQFPFSTEDPITGQEITARFRGGLFKDQEGMSFEDFRFQVDPSMGYQSEAMALEQFDRVCQRIDAVLMRAANPVVNAENLANMAFAGLKVRGGAKRFLHLRVLEQAQLMQAAAMGAAGVAGAAGMPQDAADAPDGPEANNPAPGRQAGGRPGGAPAGANDVRSVAAKIGASTKRGGSPSGMSVQVAGGAA